MEFFIITVLAVLGAALVVGGIVGYLKSEGTRNKVISAAAVAAGVVMWAVILFIVPVTTVGGP
ncbi:MAG: hypothetical protein Q8Q07_01505 [Dehalococcoidales bacterium]|nr:hypothetical protein [Dehalococcoidales bacterium]